ncbi:PAAR domain-containing protein [Pseudomonas aeruginosa]|uniref:PAAR domain-containing protein n=1 Tax=Pseudomonas aeruginosa TaxID=287 RepID=UPI00232AF349|nr:PAAR domain-containing protein [Pseudomonas aeruginosa]
MKRYHITLGARTTAGGTVTSAWEHASIEGRPMAREGDSVFCPACGSVGVIVCVGPRLDEWLEQRSTALDGDLCRCRCDPPPRLIANQTLRCQQLSSEESAARSFASRVPSPGRSTARPPTNAWRSPTVSAPGAGLEEEEEEEEQTGITLRLGLFFDGTGNNQANSAAAAGCHPLAVGLSDTAAEDIRQHCAAYGYDGEGRVPDNSYGNDVTNVARLYNLYPDNTLAPLEVAADEAYVAVYLEGVGTHSGGEDSLYSQGTGQGPTGVLARIRQMPALVIKQVDLLRSLNPLLLVERIEIDLFGFSRGAAAARHCANELLKGPDSLLAQALPAGSPLFARRFAWRRGADFALNFIGLFDTVAGIIAPLRGDFSPHDGRNAGLALGLVPGCARRVVQLVAGNEYRHNFSLVRTDDDIRLPGAHADIGGGYLPEAVEKVLLSRPESNRVSQGQADDNTEAYWRTRQCLERELPRWRPYVQRLGIATWSVALPQRRGELPEKRVYAALSSERRVRGELSRVYLRIMRELAVRAGVAFKVIEERDPALSIPDELRPIAAKLQAYALGEDFTGLSEEEIALLCRRYIHLSAHWNAAKGKHNSALAVMFINRPAEGGKRKEYPNA